MTAVLTLVFPGHMAWKAGITPKSPISHVSRKEALRGINCMLIVRLGCFLLCLRKKLNVNQ